MAAADDDDARNLPAEPGGVSRGASMPATAPPPLALGPLAAPGPLAPLAPLTASAARAPLLASPPLPALPKPLTSLRSLAVAPAPPASKASKASVHAALGMHASLVDTALMRETMQLLVAGGDPRIALAGDGRNRYGCGARPDPTLAALGSSTASVVSIQGFEAARAFAARLLAQPGRAPLEMATLREDILELIGADAVAGTQLILAASGTDLHLIASCLAAGADGEPLGTVTVEASETGTGVLPALALTHFGAATCRGHAVQEGTPIASDRGPTVKTVRLRHADGTPRDPTVIDADFERHVDAVVQSGARCLLSLTDLTKTGLIAPSPACAQRLHERHGERLVVLVDACQFRIAPSTLCAYLERGFLVAVTGSKFVGGPVFCGALLLPYAFAVAARDVPLDPLRPYASRSEWPEDWCRADVLDPAANLGLMARWRAALDELRRFRAVPDGVVALHLDAFALAVSARLATDPAFEALGAPPLMRSPHVGAWDDAPTLFPFVVHRPLGAGRRAALTMAETAALHVRMRQPTDLPAHHDEASHATARMRFQLGQPVACGMRGAAPVSALRIAASARLVADAASHDDGIAPAIDQAMRALDKLALLAGWPR